MADVSDIRWKGIELCDSVFDSVSFVFLSLSLSVIQMNKREW